MDSGRGSFMAWCPQLATWIGTSILDEVQHQSGVARSHVCGRAAWKFGWYQPSL